MNMKIRIECGCKSFADIPITSSKYTAELDLTQSIEQNSNGLFYCSKNYADGMLINCTMCGEDITLIY